MDITDNMDFVQIFEEKLCRYTGFKYAVVVDCCTNGILISLEALLKLGGLDKSQRLVIPNRTYMSIPMTLKNNGWRVRFENILWSGKYEIGNTSVFDAATDFKSGMAAEYGEGDIVCVSFQQKKRLALGRGGVIFLNNAELAGILRRLRYDGRDCRISDRDELKYHRDDIICGYHCYLEPDKAARGILLLNQPQALPPYVIHSYMEYEDLSGLKIW